MSLFDLDGRSFVPVHNTVGGAVSDATRFDFSQNSDEISAVYAGGDIKSGHIIGRFINPNTAELVYHCLTTSDELKAGQAQAHFSVNEAGRICIDMQWQWLTGDQASGTSHYEEVLQ